ncbi:MAG: CoA transferase [Actinomycetia bacterium]|nr:CoA transferase [Actinomycetes bacterium]
MEQALADIRVLELCRDVAGAFAGRLFADFGADVIKVEPPGGDPTRRAGPFPQDRPHLERSGLFLHLNRNKRGITLAVEEPSGRALFRRLAATADVVLESFGPGRLEAWNLGWEALARDNPRLVLGRLSTWGQTGPYRNYPGGPFEAHAFGGPFYETGSPDRPPLTKPGELVACQVGNTFAAAVLGAVYLARRTGTGQEVDAAAVEILLASVDRRAITNFTYQLTGHLPRRVGQPPRGPLPRGIYPCADGWVDIATVPAWVPRMLATLGDPDLTAYFRDHPQAAYEPATAERVEPVLHRWLSARTRRQCFEEAVLRHGWPVYPVQTVADALEDPHFCARGFFVTVNHPAAGSLPYPGAPWRMAEGGFAFRRPAPLLGQDNADVLGGELGLGPEDLARLCAAGII